MRISTPTDILTDVPPTKALPDSHLKTTRTYTIQLPSNGQLYGGKSSVDVSFFNTLDIKRLYDIQNGTKTDSIESLIGSKIHDFKVEDLTIPDFWYVLYWMRMNSFDKYPIQISWTCDRQVKDETCGVTQETDVTAESLVVSEIDKEYQEPMFLKLPNSGELGVKLNRISDTLLIYKLQDREFKGKPTEGDTWLLNKAAMISNGLSLYENYLLVKKMNPDDLFMLDAFEEEFMYGVRNVVNLKCSGCGEVSRIPFQLRIAHFFPSMQSSRFVRDAIRSGSASASTSSK